MGDATDQRRVVARNRRARRDYEIIDTFEAGLMLRGSEVKSLRRGSVDLADAHAVYREGEVYLVGLHIAAYEMAGHFNHEPRRERKLLLHKRFIERLGVKIRERGLTAIPLEIYFKQGWAKVELALAKGKRRSDRRDVLLAKQQRREIREATAERRRR